MLVPLQGIEQIREHVCHIIRDWLVLNCHLLWNVCLGFFDGYDDDEEEQENVGDDDDVDDARCVCVCIAISYMVAP